MDSGEIHILEGWDSARPLGEATDASVLACVERLLARGSVLDRVVLLAGEDGERRAAALGLRTPLVVPPASMRAPRWRDGLTRVLALMERPARIVCWGEALADRVRLPESWRQVVQIEMPGESLPERLPAGTRASVRAALGLPEDEYALVLAADPPDALSVQDFVRACALVALVGRNVTAIVPRQAPEMDRAKATLRDTGIPVRLMTCEAPIWTILPCADAAVVDVMEGTAPRFTPHFSRKWFAATCARMDIPVAWPEADRFGLASLDDRVLRPRSRLAVHVARAINEHFLARGEVLASSSIEGREVVA